jgi:hypothetical protein
MSCVPETHILTDPTDNIIFRMEGNNAGSTSGNENSSSGNENSSSGNVSSTSINVSTTSVIVSSSNDPFNTGKSLTDEDKETIRKAVDLLADNKREIRKFLQNEREI